MPITMDDYCIVFKKTILVRRILRPYHLKFLPGTVVFTLGFHQHYPSITYLGSLFLADEEDSEHMGKNNHAHDSRSAPHPSRRVVTVGVILWIYYSFVAIISTHKQTKSNHSHVSTGKGFQCCHHTLQ